MLRMHLKNFDWTQVNVMQCTVHWGPCAGENSGRGWLSLAAESWYAACRDLVKMRWMRVKGEWEGWRKEGGGGFSRFLAGVRYQEAAKALLMPHTSSPQLLIPWNNKWKAVISAAGHISQMTQPCDGNMDSVEWHKLWRGELWCCEAKFTFCLAANIKIDSKGSGRNGVI